MSDTKKTDWREREIGALWLKETSKGDKFFSGTIDGKKVSIWKNKFYEEGSDQPRYRVYRDELQQTSNAASKPTPKKIVQEDDSPDIPF
jgi:hypothetical protein